MNFTSDSRWGSGTSLREAVLAQSLGGAQTITFSPALAGQTITVSNGWNDANDDTALRVGTNVTVDGGTGLTINLAAPVPRRLFLNGGTVTLRNRTLSGGNVQGVNDGGAMWSSGSASLDAVRLTNNKAKYGGAVQSLGTLTVHNCTLDGNFASNNGGAISAYGDLTASNCTFTGNSAQTEGGAIQKWSGATNLVLQNCTFSGNIAGNSNYSVVTGNGGTFTAQSANNLLGANSATQLTNGSNGNQLSVPVGSLLLGSLANNGGPTKQSRFSRAASQSMPAWLLRA